MFKYIVENRIKIAVIVLLVLTIITAIEWYILLGGISGWAKLFTNIMK